MAQQDINIRERATYIAEETSFSGPVSFSGSFPHKYARVFPVGDDLSLIGGIQTQVNPVADAARSRFNRHYGIVGPQGPSQAALKCLLKSTPSAYQLTASGVVGELTPRILLRHAFGAEHAAPGTTVAAWVSNSVFSLAVASSTNLAVGTWIAVEVNGEMEPVRINAKDAVTPNTIRVTPDLSGVPSTGAIVRNLYNYAPSQFNTKSLAVVQKFAGDSGVDSPYIDSRTYLSGCYGNISFDLPEFGKLPSMSLQLAVTRHSSWASDVEDREDVPTTEGTDEMGPSFPWMPAVTWDRLDGGPSACEGITISCEDTIDVIRDPNATSALNVVSVYYTATSSRSMTGIVGVTRSGNGGVKASLKTRYDGNWMGFGEAEDLAAFSAPLSVIQKVGSGLTASFWIFEIPNPRAVSNNKFVQVGARLHMEYALEGYDSQPDYRRSYFSNVDALPASSTVGGPREFLLAPIRVAFG